MSPKRVVIVGGTGMVGGYALRYALEHPAVLHAVYLNVTPARNDGQPFTG